MAAQEGNHVVIEQFRCAGTVVIRVGLLLAMRFDALQRADHRSRALGVVSITPQQSIERLVIHGSIGFVHNATR
jgi:hypothetical protein